MADSSALSFSLEEPRPGDAASTTVMVENTCAIRLDVGVGTTGTDALEIVEPTRFELEPGASRSVQVRYVSATGEDSTDSGSVVFSAMEDDVTPLEIPAEGSVLTRELSVTLPDFSPVYYSCSPWKDVVLQNTGSLSLTVSAVTAELPSAEWEVITDGLPLPKEIRPGQGFRIPIHYIPDLTLDEPTELVLHLEHDDLEGAREVRVTGRGQEWSRKTADEESEGSGVANQIVFVFAGDALDSPYLDGMVEAMPHVFDDTHFGLEVTAIAESDACVRRTVLAPSWYKTEDDHFDALREMVRRDSGGSNSGFGLLLNGLRAECNLAFTWERVKARHYVFVSDRDEVSGLDPAEVVSAVRAETSDAATDTMFSAIVPPEPSGCDGLRPGTAYLETSDLTLGKTYSLCDADWDAVMSDISWESGSMWRRFFLEEVPIPESIRVTSSGTPIPPEGWTYDAATNTVEVHERKGALLVSYAIYPPSCD